jgi:competence protein ComEA
LTYQLGALTLLVVLVAASVGYLLLNRPRQTILAVDPAAYFGGLTAATPEPICCYVVGAVAQPGVYALRAGAVVQDAIQAAGGPAEDADLASLNLSATVRDQDQIIIPRSGVMPAVNGTEADRSHSLLLIDINTAGSEELQMLPGIGPVLAERILQFRQEFGPFERAEDLVQVKGIGDKTLADLLPFTVAGP